MTDFFTSINQITFTPGNPLTLQSISFTGTVLQGLAPFNHTWMFGDGGTASGDTVVHSYSERGRYEVALYTMDALNHNAITTDILTISVEFQSPSVPGLIGMASAGFLLATLGPIAIRRMGANKRIEGT